MGKRLPEHTPQEYPDWGMERCSEEAAAAGRREPYHLTYIRKYGQVSKMLGHEQIGTTQIYLDLSEEDLRQAHKKYVI